MSPALALSWLNLSCALKPAIGIGKRTLSHPASLPRPRDRGQGPLPYRASGRRRTARSGGAADSLDEAKVALQAVVRPNKPYLHEKTLNSLIGMQLPAGAPHSERG
jgi:hypothetical protein